MKVSTTGYKRNSKDKNEPALVIPSRHITMKGVDFPVMGVDNTGYSRMMYPGIDYQFPGNYVYEIPVPQYIDRGWITPQRPSTAIRWPHVTPKHTARRYPNPSYFPDGGYVSPGKYKNPEGNWVVKAQNGLQYIDEPTRADSLELLNNSRMVLNYYKSKGYDAAPPIYLKNEADKKDIQEATESARKYYDPNKERQTPAGIDAKVPLKDYYKKKDKNKYYQREYANSILDTRSPMVLYDKRILPTVEMGYMNDIPGDVMMGDMVSIGAYDPLSITPWDMLTDKQKKLRVKRFGRSGVPESYDPNEPEKPATPARVEPLEPLPIKLLPLQGPEDRLIREYDVLVPNEKYRKVYDKSPYSTKEYGPEGMFTHWAKEDEKIPGIWRPIKGTPSDLFVSKRVKYQNGGNSFLTTLPSSKVASNTKNYTNNNKNIFEESTSIINTNNPEDTTKMYTRSSVTPSGKERFMEYYQTPDSVSFKYDNPFFGKGEINTENAFLRHMAEKHFSSKFINGGDISIPNLRKAQIGLSVPSGKTAFSDRTEDFYNKYRKPVAIPFSDERMLPTVEQEKSLPQSYRRNMGQRTTTSIQEKLKQYDPSLEVDGVWGPKTETAYRKYWNKHTEDKQNAVRKAAEEAAKLQDMKAQQEAYRQSMFYSPEAMPTETRGPQFRSEPMLASEKWKMRSQGDGVKTLIEQAEKIASSNSVVLPGQSGIDYYNKENPVTGKPLKQYSREELVDYVNNSGQVSSQEDTLSAADPNKLTYQKDLGQEEDHSLWDYAKHYYDILSDPFKAARMSRTEQYNPFGDLVLNVPDVPWGFDDAQEDESASAAQLTGGMMSAFNPLTYINAAGRLVAAAPKPSTYYDLANTAAVGGKSLLSFISNDQTSPLISDEQKQSAFRGLGTVTDALTVAPMAAEVKPFVKGFAQGSAPAALQRFTNYMLTPSSPLTEIERSSVASLRKAHNILAQNKIGSSPGVSKSTMKMIVADPKLLTDFQSAVRDLHPKVVRKLIGKENFNEFGKHFKTSTKGLGVEEMSRVEEIGLGLQNRGYMSMKKPSTADMENPLYRAGYNLVKPPSFTENFELEKVATTLVPQMHATDKNVLGKLREAFNKVDAAEPGELFVGSSNMSVDSYAITNNRLVSSLKDGSVKIHDIKMAPLNNQGVATATANKSFYKAALKQVNDEINTLSQKINQNLPKAYFDVNSQRIIAPYIVVEKTAAPKLIRVQVKVKTPSGTEKEIKYVKPDFSDLKPNETVIKQMPRDYNPRYKAAPEKYSRGGQSKRYINNYNDFVNIWNS